MRILKYIFLLLLLALIAVTVYVATQKGQFNISKTRVINSQRTVVYNYVTDLHNWESWNSWKLEDDQMSYKYSPLAFGKGGSFSWIGRESDGKVTTTYVKENDSISQSMLFNGSPTTISWKFKDTIGGTKVTWNAIGRLDFKSKIFAVAKGGAGSIFSTMFEKSLLNLDRVLDYEINTYSVKVQGITQKTGVMYLRQTINSTIANAVKNQQILLSKMVGFFKENKIAMNGKPFVIYHSYNEETKLTKFSVCVPIREEIYTSAGSDITFGKLPSFRALKVTLNGDYSHRNEAWLTGAKYIADNNLDRISDFKSLEIITAGIPDVKNPSKWITDIYLPLKSQEITPVSNPRPIPVAASRPGIREDVPIVTPPVISTDK